jgi:DNA-binding SARP family transcriptional activator
VKFRSQLAASLLYALAGDGPQHTADLVATLWPICPVGAEASRLRTAIWDARRTLGTDAWRLERDGDSLYLNISGAQIER